MTDLGLEEISALMSKYNIVTGDEGKLKDYTIEDLEERVADLGTPEVREWFRHSCPDSVDPVPFEPYKLYRVKQGAEYRLSVPGSIVAPYSVGTCDCGKCAEPIRAEFLILRCPSHWVGVPVEIHMKDLEEVTVEQLRKEESK